MADSSSDPGERDEFTLEVHRLLDGRGEPRSWLAGLVTLAVSVILFALAGLLAWNLRDLLLLVAILTVHEGGHYLGMRMFGYRDVRVFFVPFLGAATSGRPKSVAPSKEAVVLFLGPIPGIVIGTILVLVASSGGSRELTSAGTMIVGINGFNLLPVFPLDGGRLLNLTLFNRHRYLEPAFQLLGALGLVALALTFADVVLGVFGLLIGLGSVRRFQINGIAHDLQDVASVEHQEDHDWAPSRFVDAALSVVRESSLGRDPKQAAMSIRQIWDRLITRSPSIPATLAILVTHMIAFVVASAALIVGMSGNGNMEALPVTADDRKVILNGEAIAHRFDHEWQPFREHLTKSRDGTGVVYLTYEYGPGLGSDHLWITQKVKVFPPELEAPGVSFGWQTFKSLIAERSDMSLEARGGPIEWGEDWLNGALLRGREVVGHAFFGTTERVGVECIIVRPGADDIAGVFEQELEEILSRAASYSPVEVAASPGR